MITNIWDMFKKKMKHAVQVFKCGIWYKYLLLADSNKKKISNICIFILSICDIYGRWRRRRPRGMHIKELNEYIFIKSDNNVMWCAMYLEFYERKVGVFSWWILLSIMCVWSNKSMSIRGVYKTYKSSREWECESQAVTRTPIIKCD